MNENERKILAMQQLIESEGWDILRQQIQKQVDVALASMRNAKTPDEIARHGMVYLAQLDTLSAPMMLLGHFQRQAKSVDKTPHPR